MKNIILGACLLAALATIGCKKKKTTPPPPELSVTLVDPGEAPLEPLRYAIPARYSGEDAARHPRCGGRRSKKPRAPRTRLGCCPGSSCCCTLARRCLIPKGTRYILRISKAESVLPEGVTERQMAEVEQGVQALRGMRGRFDLNGQGIVVDADVPWAQGQERIHPRVAITIGNVRSAVATIPLPRAGRHRRGMGGSKAPADLERARDSGDAI